MNKFDIFLEGFPNQNRDWLYPLSLNQIHDTWVFMVKEKAEDFIIAWGKEADSFSGQSFFVKELPVVKAPLTHENANVLRSLFPFTAPIRVLGNDRSVGVGDRLGLACPGHIRVFKEYDAYPVFAQQSIRELTLTNRTFEEVLDHVTFSVFREGYKKGFGADGDHLKKAEEVEYALRVGYTMITLDCSEYIRDVSKMSKEEVNLECTLCPTLSARYLNRTFKVEDCAITFDEDALKRCVLIYGKAIEYASEIYHKFFANGKANADFEISIDETSTPTEPLQHFFVANEMTLRQVKFETLAPRFIGQFQKGVDFIGDLGEFEKALRAHASIARYFGYKLSIHSGSDKFSTFELIGKYTQGRFHLKTAGTNWLEAMKTIAICEPDLYREIHQYALSKFSEATKFYHVTTDINKIPNLNDLSNDELITLFTQNDARQLIHITYGFILNAKNDNGDYLFKTKLYQIWREKAEVYATMLHQHIGRHLALLYQGYENRITK